MSRSTQLPPQQASSRAQAIPQLPQCSESKSRFLQTPSQHPPPEQSRPQAPQWAGSESRVLQLESQHASETAHDCPQAPQWDGSNAVFTHVSEQHVPVQGSPAQSTAGPAPPPAAPLPLDAPEPLSGTFPPAPPVLIPVPAAPPELAEESPASRFVSGAKSGSCGAHAPKHRTANAKLLLTTIRLTRPPCPPRERASKNVTIRALATRDRASLWLRRAAIAIPANFRGEDLLSERSNDLLRVSPVCRRARARGSG